MKGIVNTADFIDDEILASYFTAKQGKEKVKITWDNSRKAGSFHFTLDSVRRTEELAKVELYWDATFTGKELKGKQRI